MIESDVNFNFILLIILQTETKNGNFLIYLAILNYTSKSDHLLNSLPECFVLFSVDVLFYKKL